MRSIRVPSLLLATALIAAAATGCATEDGLDDADQISETDDAIEVSAAAAVTLSVHVGCSGPFPVLSGQVTPASATLKFNGLSISHPGGFFEFRPGGSGTLVAKSGSSTRSFSFNWHAANCDNGPGDPDDPR
jgi:hypothetical protein